MCRITIDWPTPPSVNRLWRGTAKGGKFRVYKNQPYVKWQHQAGLEWMVQKPKGFVRIDGPFEATIIIFPKRKSGDLENKIKALLDTCQLLGIIKDDKNCRRHTAWLGDASEAPTGARIIIKSLKDKLGLDKKASITQIGSTNK